MGIFKQAKETLANPVQEQTCTLPTHSLHPSYTHPTPDTPPPSHISTLIPILWISTTLDHFIMTDPDQISNTHNTLTINNVVYHRATVPYLGYLWNNMSTARRLAVDGKLDDGTWEVLKSKWQRIAWLARWYVDRYKEVCEREEGGKDGKTLEQLGREWKRKFVKK